MLNWVKSLKRKTITNPYIRLLVRKLGLRGWYLIRLSRDLGENRRRNLYSVVDSKMRFQRGVRHVWWCRWHREMEIIWWLGLGEKSENDLTSILAEKKKNGLSIPPTQQKLQTTFAKTTVRTSSIKNLSSNFTSIESKAPSALWSMIQISAQVIPTH